MFPIIVSDPLFSQTMNWLLKTEPESYSYFDLEQVGTTVWDGVNNALALKHMRTMLPLQQVLIYHTGKERQIVGMGEIVTKPYPDPKLSDAKRVVVDVRAVKKLPLAVKLSQIKSDSTFESFELLRLPRLSVVPVSDIYWQRLLELAS